MKILLINTPIWMETKFVSAYNPNLGLLYIGAMLRKDNNDVKIIDAEALTMTHDDILKLIEEWKPTHVGISCLSVGMNSATELIRKIKDKFSNIFIVFGGVGPSADLNKATKTKADSIVIGEGELILKEAFSKKGIHVGIPVTDLDSLPFPAYDLLEPKLGSSKWIRNKPEPQTNNIIRETIVMWSRGCPHQCIFCSKAVIKRGLPRLRSPQNIIRELEMLVKEYNINSIFIYDDELIGMNEKMNKWLLEITNLIIEKKLNISFKAQGRCNKNIIEHAEKIGLLSNMKKAGFFAMMMGCESGSEKVKNRIKKGTTNEDIIYTLQKLYENKIKVYGFWMVGMPEETHEDVILTEKLIKETAKYMDWIQITIFSPLQGSEFFEEAKKNNWLIEDYEKNINFQTTPLLNMPWMTREQIVKSQLRLYNAYEFYRRRCLENIC